MVLLMPSPRCSAQQNHPGLLGPGKGYSNGAWEKQQFLSGLNRDGTRKGRGVEHRGPGTTKRVRAYMREIQSSTSLRT